MGDSEMKHVAAGPEPTLEPLERVQREEWKSDIEPPVQSPLTYREHLLGVAIHRGPVAAKWVAGVALIYALLFLVFMAPFFFAKVFAAVAAVIVLVRVVFLLRR
ncbi:hypothetical protein DSM104443_01178 [Usitatibacter rugosus]|uniref:Uncharacterized protein n=1 Tax=Usitatibacter rugosus TaxID=2732067 RepID=A0A6M4GUG8_9PROT|nr:hypothetical protein [Usitatibacter rugosus]QJR10124.1 hypothetical protein DSM104443_01178 [Usitatibacter rugosus]